MRDLQHTVRSYHKILPFVQVQKANWPILDMADHYGDAEVTFGLFRSSQPDAKNITCATKYCVFEPITITKEIVEANVSERLSNINADTIELLQLHWQFVGSPNLNVESRAN